MSETTQTQSLLQDLEITLVPASVGKRFANYIIDVIVFYVFMFIVGMILAVINPGIITYLDDDSASFKLADRVVSLIIYGLFMGICEAIFKGRTLGKVITGTKAVNESDGTPISAKTAFLRGLSRIVPLEPFSTFNNAYPWHDKWTETRVIDIKESSYPNTL